MARGRKSSSDSAWRAAAAWAALAALLVQVLLPSLVMAATPRAVQQVEICTAEGRQLLAVDRNGTPVKPPAGLPCIDCLAALTAALPPPILTVRPAEQVVVLDLAPATHVRLQPRARPPPRPPGQAPPPRSS